MFFLKTIRVSKKTNHFRSRLSVSGHGHEHRGGMETGMVTGIGGRWRRAWRRAAMVDGGGHGRLREQQAHGTWLTTTVTAQASALSLLAYAHPTLSLHASLYPETRTTLAQHDYAHPIMPSPSIGAQHNYLDVTPGLEPRTTIQLQGNKMRPHAIHYADDAVLLLPRLPSLLSLLFYDAFSHHIHVFQFVSVNSSSSPAAEMATHEEMATQGETAKQDEIATQEVTATQEEPAEYTL